jgi:hypothetical protein
MENSMRVTDFMSRYQALQKEVESLEKIYEDIKSKCTKPSAKDFERDVLQKRKNELSRMTTLASVAKIQYTPSPEV